MPVIINGTTGISGVDGSAGTPAFQGSDANTGIRFGTDIVSLVTGGSDRLYIDSSGRLGIGTTSPGEKLHVAGDGIRIDRTAGDPYIDFYTSGSANNVQVYGGSSTGFRVFVGGSERTRVDTSGRLLVGTSSDVSGGEAAALIQSVYSTGALTSIGRDDTTVNNNDFIGGIDFHTKTGASSTWQRSARILCWADADQGSGDAPGRLTFSTTADGASSPTERMRIANDGSISSVIPGGSTLYPRFGCRAWVNFNGTGTVAIRGSGNVSSITDNGTGDYTVNFTTAMADANYAAVAGAGNGDDTTSFINGVAQVAPTTSAVRLKVVNSSTVASDRTYVHIAIFR